MVLSPIKHVPLFLQELTSQLLAQQLAWDGKFGEQLSFPQTRESMQSSFESQLPSLIPHG